VDEVKLHLGQPVAHQIVPAHLNSMASVPLKETGIDIQRQHRAGASHAAGQHPCHRAGAGADIQTAPALAHADRVQLSSRQRIVEMFKEPQASLLEIGRALLGEDVLGQCVIASADNLE
jgi:hypothetical protein